LLVIGLLAAGCSGAASPPDRLTDVRAARQFESFALYWLGERFEKWELTEIVGLDERTEFVTLVYGDCEPSGGLQPSCTPPLEVQVFPLCPHLDVVARDPMLEASEDSWGSCRDDRSRAGVVHGRRAGQGL
jgi:hypothetical protein